MASPLTLLPEGPRRYLYGGILLLVMGGAGFAVQTAWLGGVAAGRRLFVMQSYFVGAFTGVALALSWVALVAYADAARGRDS